MSNFLGKNFTAVALGLTLSAGVLVSNSFGAAPEVEKIMAAAAKGDAKAQTQLGILYYQGQGVLQHFGDAATWLKKAAEQGEVVAQRILGVMYFRGQGVPVDQVQGLKWLTLAAEGGDATAQTEAAFYYVNGGNGVEKDYAKAAKFYTKAAE
jgi:hypothetical protein